MMAGAPSEIVLDRYGEEVGFRFSPIGVRPLEAGVVLHHRVGALKIKVADLGQPAAFAYDVVQEPARLVIRIVRSGNVDVHLRLRANFLGPVTVRTCTVSRVDAVPPQGSVLPESAYRFDGYMPDDLTFPPINPWLAALIDLGISLIPGVGLVYDVAQLAYAAVTGKDFWGQEVSTRELLLMGFATVVGTASSLNRLRNRVRGTTLERVADEDLLREVRRVSDPDVVEAVGKLPAAKVDQMVDDLGRHLANPAAVRLPDLLSGLHHAIEPAVLPSLERRLVTKVFNEDFTGFRDAALEAAYRRYTSQAKFAGRADEILDPVSWAKRQAAAKHGAPHALLRRAIGDDYVAAVNRATDAKRLPRPLTRADIANYDEVVKKGVTTYSDLRAATAGRAGFGDHFELDHLLEQRFWRNNPNLVTAFDEKGLGMAFVVPKNAASARAMHLVGGGEKITYVHGLKTRGLKRLIPHGAEGVATVQEIWDAHVHVLRSLGAHKTIYNQASRMAQDFALLASELGQPFSRRLPSPRQFRTGQGWPQFVQQPDGAWARVSRRRPPDPPR
jgi:hypothetical protein